MALIRISPHPCFLDIQNDLFQAPLHLAVITRQPSSVRQLLLAGADVTIRDQHGNSPLHLACQNGYLDCVRELTSPLTNDEILQQKSRANLENKSCVCLPDLEQRNYDGELCVHLATLGNHVDILKHLIISGADINAREGKSGRTPLHLAIEEGKQTVANFLIEQCSQLHLETVTYAGLTAYQLAALNENQNLLDELSQKGAEPLSPPESDDDSDFDENMMDRYRGTKNLYHTFNGATAINVS
jgi:ankyrin only family protein